MKSSTPLPTERTPLLPNECSNTCSVDDALLSGTSQSDRCSIRSRDEKWNDSSADKWRVTATFYSFVVVGATDGAYGVYLLLSTLSVIHRA